MVSRGGAGGPPAGGFLLSQPPPAQGSATGTPLSDRTLVRQLWPLILTSFLTQLPTSGTTIFSVPMAADSGTSVAVVGSLRGLGGLAALATGILAAPLIDRLPRAVSVSAGLVLLALSALLAALAQVWALATFFCLLGAATAVILPAVQSAGVDGRRGAAGTRAATLLVSIPSTAPALAAVVLALPAVVWGWQGDYRVMALACLGLAGLTFRRLDRQPPRDVRRTGYLAAFGVVGRLPGATWLLLGSTIRATQFFVGITYVGALFVERHQLPLTQAAFLVSLNGLSFFCNSIWAGRQASRPSGGRITPGGLIVVGLLISTVSGPLSYLAPTVWLATIMLIAVSAGHAICVAGIMGLLVRRYAQMRGAVMGLNVAGINLGTFVGASLGGLGIVLAGYEGLAAILGLMGAAAAVPLLLALREAPRTTERSG